MTTHFNPPLALDAILSSPQDPPTAMTSIGFQPRYIKIIEITGDNANTPLSLLKTVSPWWALNYVIERGAYKPGPFVDLPTDPDNRVDDFDPYVLISNQKTRFIGLYRVC